MKHKILSLLTAFAMASTILVAPFTSAKADQTVTPPGDQYYDNGQKPVVKEGAPEDQENATTTSTIKIHKIVMSSTDLNNWSPENNRTNGGKITAIKQFFGASAEEVAGVYFEVYKEVPAGTAGAVAGADLKAKHNNSDKIDATKAYKLVKEGLTKADGTEDFDLSAELDKDGENVKPTKFVIVENLEKTTYTKDGKLLNKNGKAIPALIELPATIMGGAVLNLYPKNTDADKPEVVKDYKEQFKQGDQASNDALNNLRDQETIDKDKSNHQIGDEVTYRVETLFKENTSYKTAYWNDNMTAGLTYKKGSVKVFIDGQVATDKVDYTLDETAENGFTVQLTEAGLKKVSDDKKHLVALEYAATLNEKAIVNIPESNDVDFFYGNDAKQGNTPIPVKPVDKKITVKKEWDNGKFAEDEEATFQLYDASTGQAVGEKVTLKKGNDTHTWEGLDNEKSYKAVEINRKDGVEVSYEKTADGQIKAVNHIGHNQEVNPKEPKLVHHGKKFVKISDRENKRVAGGATFVIMNENKDKYLAQKSEGKVANNRQEYTEVKAIYDQMVADAKTNKEITQDAIDQYYTTQVAPKYKELNTKYEWITTTDPANEATVVKLTSNEKGQFAIDGLKDGNYNLKEIKAPEGYAKLTEEVPFTVSANSWESEGDIEFAKDKDGQAKQNGFALLNQDGNKGSAQKVVNKNLTIPQTGGIGSLIFIVAGLAIMTFAFVAYKKSQVKEA